jgi:hypothetical protein
MLVNKIAPQFKNAIFRLFPLHVEEVELTFVAFLGTWTGISSASKEVGKKFDFLFFIQPGGIENAAHNTFATVTWIF